MEDDSREIIEVVILWVFLFKCWVASESVLEEVIELSPSHGFWFVSGLDQKYLDLSYFSYFRESKK